jgi:hypothetical protein
VFKLCGLLFVDTCCIILVSAFLAGQINVGIFSSWHCNWIIKANLDYIKRGDLSKLTFLDLKSFCR